MQDRTALAVLLVAGLLAAGGLFGVTIEAPPSATPDATFTVEGSAADGELRVEYADGEELPSGSLKVLVYEDRVGPDRTVHARTWREEPAIRPGDGLVVEDPRLEPGQRLVVRWYGGEGQANLHETGV